ncbi:carbohydrate ABC transporter permease [Ancylobacter sp. SL191]|uniref:carbohydrate ABC transporter permease n=1 Tax=Ancylobacter sp. SL191 TaxID=2995166 RepID=UPI00226F5B26|nr:carbohydrate ABC transporter permease [Ancylobacter sp. SL191]WAC26556.1 carbohydrate ABC transporter permease [Ancylobacter sp. SL191]
MLKRSVLSWCALLPLIAVNLFPFAIALDTLHRAEGEGSLGGFWAGLWARTELGTALVNSLVVAVSTAVISTLIALPAAYAISRWRFRGRRAASQILLASQILVPVMLVLGLSQLMAGVGLTDTRLALIGLYSAFQVPFAVWMLRGYIDAIPLELEDAARIDGASRFQILRLIVLPLSMPAVAVTATFAFITAFNEFVLALTILRSSSNFTLPIRVNALTAGRYAVDWPDVMGAVLVASVPVLLTFLWLQRSMLRGLRLSLEAS